MLPATGIPIGSIPVWRPDSAMYAGHTDNIMLTLTHVNCVQYVCYSHEISFLRDKKKAETNVGFDSQNTSHSFPYYPNRNLWVPGIPVIGVRDDSENKFDGQVS